VPSLSPLSYRIILYPYPLSSDQRIKLGRQLGIRNRPVYPAPAKGQVGSFRAEAGSGVLNDADSPQTNDLFQTLDPILSAPGEDDPDCPFLHRFRGGKKQPVDGSPVMAEGAGVDL
jgi:hypothetical protein